MTIRNLLWALLLPALAVAQNTTPKLPSAVKAPGEPLPKKCFAEPIETPLPLWMQGGSTIELTIGSDGKVYDTKILKSSYSESEKAAIDQGVRAWHFKPTYFHGYYVNARLTLEIEITKTDLQIRFPTAGSCKDAPFPRM